MQNIPESRPAGDARSSLTSFAVNQRAALDISGLESLGQAGQEVAVSLLKRERRQQAQAASLATSKFQVEAMKTMRERQEKLQVDETADGFEVDVQANFDRLKDQFRRDLRGEEAINAFDRSVESFRVGYTNAYINRAASHNTEHAKHSFNQSLDSSLDVIRHAETPKEAETFFFSQLEALGALGATMEGAVDDTVLTALQEHAQEKLAVGMVETIAGQDTKAALDLVKGKSLDQFLPGDKGISIKNHLQNKYEQQLEQLRSKERADIRGHFDAYMSLYPITGENPFPDLEKRIQALDDTEVLKEWAATKTAAGILYKQSHLPTMSFEEQRQLLDAEKLSIVGDPDKFSPEKLRALAALDRASLALQKEFVKDPVAYMAKNFPTVQSAASSGDPTRYASALWQGYEKMQVPVGQRFLLGNAEAKSFVKQVTKVADSPLEVEQLITQQLGKFDGVTVGGMDARKLVTNQLRLAGLAPEYTVGAMFQGTPGASIYFQALTTDKKIKGGLKALLGDAKESDVAMAIQAESGEYFEGLALGGQNRLFDSALLRQAVQTVTKYNIVNGNMEPQKAAELAEKQLLKPLFDVAEQPGDRTKPLLIPKGFGSPAVIQERLREATTPDRFRAQLTGSIQKIEAITSKKLIEIRPNIKFRSDAAFGYSFANALLKDTGKRVQLVNEKSGNASAYRSFDMQRDMMLHPDKYGVQRDKNGRAMVAAPGKSAHNHGMAMDISNWKDPDVNRALKKAGWAQTVPGDPNHWEYRGKRFATTEKAVVQNARRKSFPKELAEQGVWALNSAGTGYELLFPTTSGTMEPARDALGRPFVVDLDELTGPVFEARAPVYKSKLGVVK